MSHETVQNTWVSIDHENLKLEVNPSVPERAEQSRLNERLPIPTGMSAVFYHLDAIQIGDCEKSVS